ncbi:efflux RND transporter periplasmic adaptor subunit [Halochromatium glycolicum]|uniref:Efflux transporter periplasmic adaptor subunit n=1 Tax=Halochromatium glycolicum TaxID=85075 RepID=A0AAJ0U6J3_9GAMM|nr:efflux RND transporter periplasmic adaptor subunit [Halochromatium glycolicum]MBK1706201.1 efflux transporter periplasmic adaptor subunit [Halochromatium glycolicum]
MLRIAAPLLVLGLAAQIVVAQPSAPVGVIASIAELEPVADRVEALGTLRANESVTITANVTETVSVIHFDDGQRVQAGDLLVEMTSVEEHARLEEAQARLAEAEQQYRRVKSLAAAGSASASLLDERRRDLRTAEATLTAIESQLADRLVKAPFEGVVGLRDISLGALVEPGDVITTLDDDSVMKLDFAVPSLYLPSLAPGVAIEARAAALGDRLFDGAVASIDSRIDPVTRTVQVRARLPNPERTLRPGLLMRVELLRNPREALMIPEAAVMQRGDQHSVMRVAEGEGDERLAEQRPIEVGLRRPGEVEVTAGLSAGDLVITHGADKARPGQPVQVMAIDDGERALDELLAQPSGEDAGEAGRTP